MHELLLRVVGIVLPSVEKSSKWMSDIIQNKKSSLFYMFPLLDVFFPRVQGFGHNIEFWILEEKSDYTFCHVVFLLVSFFLNVLFDFISWITWVNQKFFKGSCVSTVLISSQNYFAFSLKTSWKNYNHLHWQRQRSSRIPFNDSICRNNISFYRLNSAEACVWKTSPWILSFVSCFLANEVFMQFFSWLIYLEPRQKSSCRVFSNVFVFQLQRW